MSAQRFTPNPASSQSTSIHSKRPVGVNGRTKKAIALFGTALMVAVATTIAVQRHAPSESIAAQGHAKRYLRINEYLFHGVQKKTAIAFHSAEIDNTHV